MSFDVWVWYHFASSYGNSSNTTQNMLFPYIFDYDELFRFLAISVFRTNTTTKVAPTKTTKTTTTHFVSSNALKMLLLVLSFHHDKIVKMYQDIVSQSKDHYVLHKHLRLNISKCIRSCPNKLINNENNRSEYRRKYFISRSFTFE